MSDTPEFMTHERIMTGEEYVSYSDYLSLQRERDEAREAFVIATDQMVIDHGRLREANKERDEAREELDNIRKTLSESGEAIGNGVHNYSIIEMIENLIQSRDYFVRKSDSLEQERDEAQATLTDIHRWIERNHPDGFIDSLSFHQNLERVADRWYDRLDLVESERDELIERNAKLRDIADRAIKLGQSL
jgi:seryl-tRNA synthetase